MPIRVGHTGDLKAAVAAVEAVDACLKRLLDAVTRAGGVMLVTADHGNAEMMTDPVTGAPHTAHTVLTPLILANGGALKHPAGLKDGKLADLAPTIPEMLGLPIPAEMTGASLLAPAAAESLARRGAA